MNSRKHNLAYSKGILDGNGKEKLMRFTENTKRESM